MALASSISGASSGESSPACRIATLVAASISFTKLLNRRTRRALAKRGTIREAVLDGGYLERGELTERQLDEALDVLRMTRP
jgi:hypothetical protein